MAGLITRIFLYILAGFGAAIAAALPGLHYDQAANLLTIDIGQVSEILGLAVAASIGGGTFAVSRAVKRLGGMT